MNATMVASGTKAVPPVVSTIHDIPLDKIRVMYPNPLCGVPTWTCCVE